MRGLLTSISFALLFSLSSFAVGQESDKAKKSGQPRNAEKKETEKKADSKKPAKKSAEKKSDSKKADPKKADPKKADKPAKKPASLTSTVPSIEKRLRAIFAGTNPQSIDDLKKMETHLRSLVDKVTPATVGIFNGAAGSGVIVSPDGYVLTAAHVAMEPGRTVRIVLHDGRVVRGETLGMNRGVDSGLIKITTDGVWPYADMGTSSSLRGGQWCLALGHPGGFEPGRRAPVRFGRIITAGSTSLKTDCTLVGGDSGGPLFDLTGRVIGIHSRISRSIQSNVHVPVANYTRDWDRMVKKEIIERRRSTGTGAAYLGVTLSKEAGKENLITMVTNGSAAEKAGLKPDDRIVKFNGRTIRSSRDLRRQLALKSAGDKVAIEIERGGKSVKINLELGIRKDN